MYIKEKPKKPPKNISYVLFMYWLVIILWQTFRSVENRSLADTAVKMGVFFAVVVYAYAQRKTKFNVYFLPLFLSFIVTQTCTFYFETDNSFKMGHIITVAFMIIQLFVFLGWGAELKMNEENLSWFCHCTCCIVTVMCIYNVIFSWNKFTRVFSSSTATYGSECKSFLYSNHEFCLYISFGMISLLWLLLSKRIKPWKAALLSILFVLNQLSTFSRTAILGCIASLLILVFFYQKKLFALMSAAATGILLLIITNQSLYDFFFKKILKGTFTNSDSLDVGREEMYGISWNVFKNADVIHKIFGRGYGGASHFPGHNAYLTILLTGGIIMFLWFLFIILFGFRCSYQCLKREKRVGGLLFGFQTMALMYMVAQTPILFYSTMDSFFITSAAVLIPFYLTNGYRAQNIKEVKT